MNKKLLDQLTPITDEERRILAGETDIDTSIYYSEKEMSKKNEIDASRLLKNGKLIDIRPHTRFVHFPEHTHNFIEFVYMCQGTTTHLVDGHKIVLREGDLLFMNQHAHQEILPAGEGDIAVNFIILPQFFDDMPGDPKMQEDTTSLRDFIISCLTQKDMGGNYLYFDVAGILPIQNLVENLIWIMLSSPHKKNALSRQTMALLFFTLTENADHIQMSDTSYDQEIILKLLNYIEREYKNAALSEFSERNRIDIYSLGRIIKKQTGKTFTELLSEKRMRQAAYLLANTRFPISEISVMVGYENTSYFYRLFHRTFGDGPREYRKNR